MIEFKPIGTIHTPFKDIEGMPIQPAGAQGVSGTVALLPAYEEGLKDLDGFSHIILLYLFHRSKSFKLTVTPFLDTVSRGLFAVRAPNRPNPIGLSIVKLAEITGTTLHIKNIDVLDGTPLFDIKPYVPEFDLPAGPVKAGWYEHSKIQARDKKSDNRFK